MPKKALRTVFPNIFFDSRWAGWIGTSKTLASRLTFSIRPLVLPRTLAALIDPAEGFWPASVSEGWPKYLAPLPGDGLFDAPAIRYGFAAANDPEPAATP